MSLRFRPMPGLTAVTLLILPLLVGLGVWQYQRWQWKTGVLAEIDAAVSAPPLQGLDALADATGPLDFRRIQFDGEATGDTFLLYRPSGNIAWMPVRVVETDRQRALVGFPTIQRTEADIEVVPTMDGTRAGYVRRIRDRTGAARLFGVSDNPQANRWYGVNPDGAWLPGADLYIDASLDSRDADALPVRRPDVPNNHVSYMLTWWSFAVIWLIIYAVLHRRAGRLGRA